MTGLWHSQWDGKKAVLSYHLGLYASYKAPTALAYLLSHQQILEGKGSHRRGIAFAE